MKTINKKILSVLLVLCMIFQTGMYTIASAVTSDTLTIEDDQSDNETVNSEENVVANSNGVTLEDVLAGLASPYDYFGELDPDTVPEAVGMEKALERVHLRRLYTEETGLNDVVFLNADGTKTVYMFDYPVKTVNEHGLVTDISLEIADTTNSATPYETANGNAVTAFSNRYTDGINLSGNNVSVTLLPILPTVSTTTGLDATANAQIGNDTTASNNYFESTATRIDKKTISYKYDDSTSVEYSLTYTGFKEDIVVKEYTGQTEYDFTLVTNGLKLEERKNSFYLVDENNNIKATLGNIIIFTADNANNAYGDMTYKTVVENEKYVLTIHVSDEYLRDEKTKYPIRIDPTIEINYDSDGAGAIADITINTADPLSGTDGEISLGKWGSDQSVSRILMKFPGLNLSDIPTAASITSATVEIHDLMCQHERLGVYCYVFTGNVWSESNATWNNVSPNSHGEQLSFHYVSYADGLEQATSQRYSFNITNAVKGWKTGNYDPEKGIIFQAGAADEANTTHNYKTFASYNRSNHKPSFSVTYSDGSTTSLLQDNTYYINNSYTGKYIWNTTYTTTKSGLISSLGDSIRWEVRNVDGGCIIRSTEDTTKYLGVDDSGDFAILTYYQVSNGIIPSDCIWNVAVAFGGGLNISHTSSFGTQYLYSPVQYLDLSFSYGTVNSDLRAQSTWRVVSVDNYSNTSSTQYRELPSSYYADDLNLDVCEVKELSINEIYSNILWSSRSDFIIAINDTNIAQTTTSNKIEGFNRGNCTITIKHKVTDVISTRTSQIDVSSSFSSTMNKLEALYNAALSYDNTPRDAALLTMQFIRRCRYNGDNWIEVADSIDNQFVDYVNDNYPELFRYFTIEDTDTFEEKYNYVDPSGEGLVDFPHLCATLNGLMYDSVSFKATVAGEANVDNLCGWAGDLQTLCEDVLKYVNFSNDYDTVYNATRSMIGNSDYSFSIMDLLANTDAYNIYNLLDSSSSNLISAFLTYYDEDSDRRYTLFTNGWSKDKIYSCVRNYTTDTFFLWQDWPLLNGMDITDTQSNAMAWAFTDYIWEKIQNEND